MVAKVVLVDAIAAEDLVVQIVLHVLENVQIVLEDVLVLALAAVQEAVKDVVAVALVALAVVQGPVKAVAAMDVLMHVHQHQ